MSHRRIERRYRGRSYVVIADGRKVPIAIEEIVEGVQQLDGSIAPTRSVKYAPDGSVASRTEIRHDRN